MESSVLEQAVEQLKKDNVRITPQRYAVLHYLVKHHSHPTADEIYQAIAADFPNMSVATVYNNLRLFTDIGFVQEMKYGDASSRFDFSSKPHYHAICQNCGKIVDFYYPGLEDVEMASSQLTGFEINEHRLEVYGLCPECKEKRDENNSNT
ncbi:MULTISPECIES: Fur family transcriptional regulator [Enterococcus]|uniref:Fur family transcriptional regulator n=1 Tax=Enterococcus TaxID=1350 RepID=UPI00065DD6A8|nr:MULTISPECIES: Fur family transcriptional regulator [Enterococcus]KAF1301185.1 transcriptional repressor [Enterococcus sp. JM9B]